MQEPTRQNNILHLVITTEEALLVTLQIKDKIGDHQAIQFSLQTEKEETAVEKTNYNFRRANFEAMCADLDDKRLHLIVNSDAAQGFELLKNKILESCRRPILKKHITINNPSWIDNDVKQSIARPQRAYDERKRNNTDKTSCRGLSLAPVCVMFFCVCSYMAMLCPQKTYLSSSVISVCLWLLEVHV